MSYYEDAEGRHSTGDAGVKRGLLVACAGPDFVCHMGKKTPRLS